MFVPTSAHLCKVEHHPAGAKLSHASTDLSFSLSLSSFLQRALSGPFYLDPLSSSTPRLILRSSRCSILVPLSSISSYLFVPLLLWYALRSAASAVSHPGSRTADSRKGSATPKSVSFSLYSAVFSISSAPRR